MNARCSAADASFDWGTLLQAGASMSLFAEKRLLELRLPSGKPGDKGAAASSSTARARPKTRCC
jgi:DNA polymerase III delta subunit